MKNEPIEPNQQPVLCLGGPLNGKLYAVQSGQPAFEVAVLGTVDASVLTGPEDAVIAPIQRVQYDINWSSRKAYFNHGSPLGYVSAVPARTNTVQLQRCISEAQTMRSHPRAAVAYDNLANDLQLSLNELELRRSAMQWQRFGEAAKPYNKQHVLLLARTTERPCFAVQYNEARRAWDLGGTSAPAHNDDLWLALDALLPKV